MLKGKISEIFYSIQGEGKYLGVPQAFVRFYGCNIKCRFCDTKLDGFDELTVDEVVGTIKRLKAFHSVCITGGEPLMQAGFLKALVMRLKKQRFCCHLETNGVLYKALSAVIPYIDVIAMDIKLPTSTRQKAFWREHSKFLQIAKKREVFVKTVVTRHTSKGDLLNALKIVSGVNKNITFILQPESSDLSDELVTEVMRFQKIAQEYLKDVRVVPQMHKILGVK